MNALTFGICTNYTIAAPEAGTRSRSSPDPDQPMLPAGAAAGEFLVAGHSVTMSIVAIDPYPHHTVAGVQLIRKAVDRDFRAGKISHDSFTSLQTTLEQTLSQLPSSSKSVTAAREKLAEKMANGALTPRQDPYLVFQTQYAV